MSNIVQTNTSPLELDNIIVVDDKEYNVNAVHSDSATQVDNKLIINQSVFKETETANGIELAKATELAKAKEQIEFDGASQETISVVPSTGGLFSGRIAMEPENDLVNSKLSNEAIINYGEVLRIVEQLTGSGWFTWDGEKFSGKKDNNIPQRIGIVIGSSDKIGSFTDKNFEEKLIPSYLYISSDNGDMYFGYSNTNKYITLAATQSQLSDMAEGILTNSSNIDKILAYFDENGAAKVANKLTTESSFKTDLSSEAAGTFDGEQFKNPGVTGILPISRGGTGARSKNEAAYSIFGEIPTETDGIQNNDVLIFKHRNPSESDGAFGCRALSDVWKFLEDKKIQGDGNYGFTENKVLAETHGGTGKTTLSEVRVGSAVSASSADSADKLTHKKYFKVNLASTNSAAFDGTADAILGVYGTLPVARGGTGATDLSDVKVGKSDATRVIYNSTNKYPTITINANKPSSATTGDIWIKI